MASVLCDYCGKTVRERWLLGSLHFCVSASTRARMDAEDDVREHAKDARRRSDKFLEELRNLGR